MKGGEEQKAGVSHLVVHSFYVQYQSRLWLSECYSATKRKGRVDIYSFSVETTSQQQPPPGSVLCPTACPHTLGANRVTNVVMDTLGDSKASGPSGLDGP